MKVKSKDVSFINNLSVTPPTRCETVLKFKDRVIELNISLISEDSLTFSEDSFDEHVSTLNNGRKVPVKLDTEKCFVMRKSSLADVFVEETPRTSTPPSDDPISVSESSNSQQSSQGCSKNIRKSFVCGICKKKFVYELRYKSHMLKHKEDTITTLQKKIDKATGSSFKCNFCCKAFKSKSGVNKHEKTVHIAKKMHICSYCPKFFWSTSGLRDHGIAQHATKLGLSCKGCGKIFSSKNKMNSHMECFPNHANASG